MKTIIVTLALAFTTLTFAQNREMKREKATPEKQTEMQLKKMTTDLSLTADQQEKIKPILLEQAQKRAEKKEVSKDHKESGEKLSKEERAAMKENMKSEKEAMKVQLSNILSAEQMEKWENNKMEKREKVKEKVKDKKANKSTE